MDEIWGEEEKKSRKIDFSHSIFFCEISQRKKKQRAKEIAVEFRVKKSHTKNQQAS